MPEIQLPTAAKQNEILEKVNATFTNDALWGGGNLIATSLSASKTLEVTGKGVLVMFTINVNTTCVIDGVSIPTYNISGYPVITNIAFKTGFKITTNSNMATTLIYKLY